MPEICRAWMLPIILHQKISTCLYKSVGLICGTVVGWWMYVIEQPPHKNNSRYSLLHHFINICDTISTCSFWSDTWAYTWSWSHVTLRTFSCLEYVFIVDVVSPLSCSVVSLLSYCMLTVALVGYRCPQHVEGFHGRLPQSQLASASSLRELPPLGGQSLMCLTCSPFFLSRSYLSVFTRVWVWFNWPQPAHYENSRLWSVSP
jgi:hypothetical protein